MDAVIAPWFLIGLSVGIASDVLDGVIARRLGLASARLRQADGWADAWFFLCVLVSAWWARAEVLRPFIPPIGMMLGLYLLSLVLIWKKYGRLASYHTWSARVAGGCLYIAALELFGKGTAGILSWLAISTNILSHIERIAITLVLKRWTDDVGSVWHALRMARSTV
jgi:CDP-diacylglycerol--glycerol-3-phosphate 3-phosphatidyltransferase